MKTKANLMKNMILISEITAISSCFFSLSNVTGNIVSVMNMTSL